MGHEQALNLSILYPDTLKGNKISTTLLCYICSSLEVFAFMYNGQWLRRVFYTCCLHWKALKKTSCRSDCYLTRSILRSLTVWFVCAAPIFSCISSLSLPSLCGTLFHAAVCLCIIGKMSSDSSVRILSCITAIYSRITFSTALHRCSINMPSEENRYSSGPWSRILIMQSTL